MDITVKRSGIACCEKVFEYSMPVEEAAESVVPDTMPDVERVLCADGMAVIRSKDVSDGSVSISANVNATVLYVPDGGEGVNSLDVTVPVNVDLEAAGVTSDSLAVAMLRVANVEARLLNPRKLLVRVVVNICVECYNWTKLEISTGLDGESSDSVETLTETVTISPVVCVREKTFVVSDEYRLQPGLLPIGTLLWHTTEIIPGSIRNVGTKIIFNGTVRLTLLYEAAGSGELCPASFETEFSQMLDAESDLSSPDCSVYSMLTAEYVEAVSLAGGERGISAEFHLVSQCVCTDSVRVQCMTDCYSNECELDIGISQSELGCIQRRSTVRASVHETLAASPPAVNICRVICRTGVAECDGGMLRCAVSVTVLYTASDGMVYAAARRLSCETPSELAADEYASSVLATCAECSAAIAQGGIDVRAVVDFELVSGKRVTFAQITSVEAEEGAEMSAHPSVTIVRATDADTLWSLGKRYRSTAALITTLNGLSENEALTGRVLLIPCAGKK